MRTYPKHDEDFYGWAMATAALLKQKNYQEADMDSIIEELEDMGISNKHAFKNRLAQLIFHLLKWQYQPDFRGRSWGGTIKEQRIQIGDLLEDNPSLKHLIKEIIQKAYKISIAMIERETPIDLKILPLECPYTFEQIMNDEFYPQQ